MSENTEQKSRGRKPFEGPSESNFLKAIQAHAEAGLPIDHTFPVWMKFEQGHAEDGKWVPAQYSTVPFFTLDGGNTVAVKVKLVKSDGKPRLIELDRVSA